MTSQQKIRSLAVVLFLSLLLNCFMVGNMAGHMKAGGVYQAAQKDRTLRDSLSDSDKKVLRETIALYRGLLMNAHAELSEAREDMRLTVRAENFDQKAFDKAFSVAKEKERGALKIVREARETAMKQMSAEGRVKLVNLTRLGFYKDVRADCLVR